jgi:hypothetical protein
LGEIIQWIIVSNSVPVVKLPDARHSLARRRHTTELDWRQQHRWAGDWRVATLIGCEVSSQEGATIRQLRRTVAELAPVDRALEVADRYQESNEHDSGGGRVATALRH